jgi:hypothetical protein
MRCCRMEAGNRKGLLQVREWDKKIGMLQDGSCCRMEAGNRKGLLQVREWDRKNGLLQDGSRE